MKRHGDVCREEVQGLCEGMYVNFKVVICLKTRTTKAHTLMRQQLSLYGGGGGDEPLESA